MAEHEKVYFEVARLEAEVARWKNHPAFKPMHPAVVVWTFLGGCALAGAVECARAGQWAGFTACALVAFAGLLPVMARTLARQAFRLHVAYLEQQLATIRRELVNHDHA